MLRCARAARSADRDAPVTAAPQVRTGACTLSTIYESPVDAVKEATEPVTLARTVLVTDAGQLLAPGVDRLRAAGVDVEVLFEGTSPAEAAVRGADRSVIVIGVMAFGAGEIAALRSTRLLIRAGIGYDVIDVDAATAAGIWVANVPDYCVDEVADHAMLLLLAATRRLTEVSALWR